MSTEQNKALVRRWWDDLNAHHLDFETFIHAEMVNHGFGLAVATGQKQPFAVVRVISSQCALFFLPGKAT